MRVRGDDLSQDQRADVGGALSRVIRQPEEEYEDPGPPDDDREPGEDG